MARTVEIGFSGETETDRGFLVVRLDKEKESGDKSPHSKSPYYKP
jgi:hypothetical protein